MKYNAATVEDYINQLPKSRKEPIVKLRQTILKNLPKGFKEQILYGMISYVVPFSTYPDGHHVNPKLPLSFISLASQKNNISLYHSGVYVFPEVLAWFQQEYPKHIKTKLDMGKSCIRFKNMNNIPYDLIGELCQKITVDQFVRSYKDILEK
ncbi:MAG: DUF1801 domain-containing protein [Erysipelothrix sp.]|nr:DUF1801 domain-containing protein [Erysipelothrix sp.]